MKYLSIIAILLLSTAAFAEFNNRELKPDGCKDFNDSLHKCTEYNCVMKSPNKSKKHELIIHEIKGLNEEGKCIHNQKSTSGEIINCVYSEKTRMILSHNYEEKEGENVWENYMPNVFTQECLTISN